MTFTFIIPGRLPGTNDMIGSINRNRSVGATLKRNTTTLCAQYAVASGMPQFKRPVSISVNWVEPNAKRDLDNIRGGIKYILDGLVASGKLPNDTRQWIKGLSDSFPDPDKENPRVEITIREAWET